MKKSLSITVITKLSTPNAGNQAISTELIRLLKRTYVDAQIYTGWREPGLEQYSFTRLQHTGKDPLATLDKWAGHILERHDSSQQAASQVEDGLRQTLQAFKITQNGHNPDGIVELVCDKNLPLVLRLYNKGLRTLKAPIDRWRGYGRGYERWLNVLKCSDRVLYSPAGVVSDVQADYLVRDFLVLRIAQRLGARVTAVNQSIEIYHPPLLRLLGRLYSSFDAIVVRDYLSAQLLMEIQVPQERIKLAPDTAFLAYPYSMERHELNEIIAREKIEPGTVGIVAIPGEGFSFPEWGKVIQGLQALGKGILFISNQMSTDALIGKELQKLYGIQVLSRQYEYREYISILSLLELVISERYHTCVFSAVANRPFIPLKTSANAKRKMLGIASLLNYEIPAVDTTCSNWSNYVAEDIRNIYSHYDKIVACLKAAVLYMRELAEQNVKRNGSIATGHLWKTNVDDGHFEMTSM